MHRRTRDPRPVTTPWPAGTLLGRLQPAARGVLLAQCRLQRFKAGEQLIRQGGSDRHALILMSGQVKVALVDSSGIEVVLAIRHRGDIVGELAALTGEPRTASVIAIGQVTAGIVRWTALAELISTDGEAARELFRTQAHRLEWANQRRVDFAARPARLKIARVLADLAAAVDSGASRPVRVELKQRELASLVGVSLNTVERALAWLKKQGHVQPGRGAVTVLDGAALRALSEADGSNP